jgi:6-phosphofructokinase 1
VIVAEGAGGEPPVSTGGAFQEGAAYRIGHQIANITGFETRIIVLGHIQRGGAPSVRDRILATMFGAKAVDLLLAGEDNAVVGMCANQVRAIPFDEALAMKRPINMDYYELANILSNL